MQITFAEIKTSLLQPSDTHKIYDTFFLQCEKTRNLDSHSTQEERDESFSRICLSIKDPEHYLFLIRYAYNFVRSSLITRKPSLSRCLAGINFLYQYHKNRNEHKMWLCNHIWNLYQHIKLNGIIEPLSIVYEKKRMATLKVVILALKKSILSFPEFVSIIVKNASTPHGCVRSLKFSFDHIVKLYKCIVKRGVLNPFVVWCRNARQATRYEYGVGIGSSRVWVAKKLGIEKVKCIVFDSYDTNDIEGKKITLDDIQSYFASPVKISEIKTPSKFYYLISPERLHMKGYDNHKLHWAGGCI